MSAALTALCNGDRRVRDRARMYIDRVKIWESQGNARSIQDISVSVPAVCVWLAAEWYVMREKLTCSLNASVVQRGDLQSASGLSPAHFDRAENLIRQVIVQFEQTSSRRSHATRSATVSAFTACKPTDKATLIERAKKVQQNAMSHKAPVTSQSSRAAQKQAMPAAFNAAMTQPRIQTKPDDDKTEQQAGVLSLPPPPEPATSALSLGSKVPSSDPSHMRLLALGLPAFREGLNFDVQPRRKRGRPPAKRLTPQQINDKQFLESLWSNSPLPSSARTARMPSRYSQSAQLTAHEVHWIYPLSRPLLTYSGDPSSVRLKPSLVWEKWLSRSFS